MSSYFWEDKVFWNIIKKKKKKKKNLLRIPRWNNLVKNVIKAGEQSHRSF